MLVKTGQLGTAGPRDLCAGASVEGAAPTADALLGPDSVERAQPAAAKASTSRLAGASSFIMAASIMRLGAWTRVIPSRFPIPGRPVAKASQTFEEACRAGGWPAHLWGHTVRQATVEAGELGWWWAPAGVE